MDRSETLAILKPLLLARIDMYNQGHLTRLNDKTAGTDPNELDDVGVILGGDQDTSTDSSSRNLKRNQTVRRPRFSIWYGFRDSTMAERGSALLLSNKKLGFLSKVKEEVQEEGASKLAQSLGGDIGGVVIREEEDDSLRVSDFPLATDDSNEHLESQGGSEDEYHDPADSSKRPRKSTADTGKGRAIKKNKGVEGGSADQKPTLNVSYSPLKLLPHTLHISIRSLGALTTGERITGGDFPEDEQDLFPPNLDFFA
ncbi:hypothetical protein BGZ93_009800 [Podila epicladia]|nr:hypothetical protein BGZ93_009800 [Podila epicladia]KAG0090695.1 hypothetical protein BGZ92_002413 [Podila epicladia]